MKHLLLFILCIPQLVAAQKLTKSDKAIIENLKSEIGFLASDKLEGRRTGTAGEQLAYEYLAAQFKNIGLAPKGNNGYIQPFEVDEGKQILPATNLSINENALELNKDFFPLEFSGNGKIKENVSPAIREKDAPWFLDINDLLEENANNPHFDLVNLLKVKTGESIKMGASAFIIFNSGDKDDGLQFDGKSKISHIINSCNIYN